jgi:hypothetical protein
MHCAIFEKRFLHYTFIKRAEVKDTVLEFHRERKVVTVFKVYPNDFAVAEQDCV